MARYGPFAVGAFNCGETAQAVDEPRLWRDTLAAVINCPARPAPLATVAGGRG